MIQFHAEKASHFKPTLASAPSTLVVIVRKSGKNAEALGADKELSHFIDAAEEDGLSFSDFKKGVFLRGHGLPPFQHTIVIGIDDKHKTLEDTRRTAASIYQLLKANKITAAAVHADSLAKDSKKMADAVSAVVEGFLLAAYEFNDYKSKTKEDEKKAQFESLTFIVQNKVNPSGFKNAIEDATTLSKYINFSRTLGNTPGNLMTPEILAEQTQKAAKGTKLKVTVWDKARIKKEKMGGLLGVSLGSAVDPRFIILEYTGGAKSKKPICFVGKGLTFDSGGISIKPSGGMEEMKFDMCGGANVISAMLAIAHLKLKVNAIAFVPSTENMPGPLATKPGDILVARNGKTVEIDNTDAEGRLILMDALSYACEQKPAIIFDAATLTGACVVALGNSYTGCFTRNDKVRNLVDKASEQSGEWIWQMPINDHHVGDMKGTYADLNNISSFKGAGSSTAAAFLEQFVDKDIPWAHFDIAGTAWAVGNRINYCSKKGASGVLVRTFVELAKSY